MRYLISFLIALALVCPATGQINNAEYCIDTDPGYGKATSVSITAGDTISKDIIVALSSVNPGFHIVSLRAKDAQGHWSHTYNHSFYVIATAGANVAASEYYIDFDPGYGRAVTIPISIAGDSLKYVIPLASYNTGFHTLGLRCKDNAGRWSHTTQHAFYVNESGVLENITALKYYFTGDGATDSIYNYQVPILATSIDLDFKAELKQLVGDREYTMHIWAENAKGVRSEVLIKKIKACNDEPAKAGFDFIPVGTHVSFINSSKGSTKYKWDFGDGITDSVSDPVHFYTSGGNFTIKQIASSFCNSDTMIGKIDVVSLQDVNPNKGGNSGTVTLIITGAGFSDLSVVKLAKDGEEIMGDTAFVNDNKTVLKVTFNLINVNLGKYDLIVSNGIFNDTIVNGFLIEKSIAPKMSVQIQGRNNIRSGRLEKYEIIINNSGNQDAVFVPLWLSVPSKVVASFGFDIYRRKNPNVNFDSISIGMPIDTLFGNKVDSSVLYYFIIPRINANSSYICNFYLTTTTFKDQEINTWVFPPLVEIEENIGGRISQAGINYVNKNTFLDCYKDAVVNAIDPFCTKDAKDVAQTLNKLPCTGDAYFKALESKDGPTVDCQFDNNSFLYNVATPIVDGVSYLAKCVTPAIIEKFGKVGKWISRIITARGFYNDVKKCPSSFVFTVSGFKNFILHTVAASDPNEKVGPSGNSISNYNKGTESFNYKLYFENKNSATAPAQEVIILDTLDKSKFDLSTFQLQSFGYGGSAKAYIPVGLTEYFVVDTLHRSGKPNLLVKTDAKLDTAKGILTWRFLSLDPQTRELVADPLDGFLPPNITSPQGEGYVSYSVTPKTSLTHGTEIKNKAVIYFDNNEPIVTNEFLNTLDKVSPVSSVSSLPIATYDSTFVIKWSGMDADAGVRAYDIYYSVNNGPFQLWQYDVSVDSSVFTGNYDSTYRFFSIAKDYAGNIEDAKTIAEATTTIKANSLPVTSAPLNGILTPNHTVSLSWKTYTEANNKGFIIERNSGSSWKEIGFVKGAGNSVAELKYYFIDSNIAVGKTYEYRYKQMDYDGKAAYSNIVLVEVKDDKKILILNVAPNPFSRTTLVTYTLPRTGNTSLRLVDFTGKEVAKILSLNQQAGTYKIDIAASDYSLSSGTYFLILSNNGENLIEKLIVIN